jgi:hypothetical protein
MVILIIGGAPSILPIHDSYVYYNFTGFDLDWQKVITQKDKQEKGS